MKTAKVLAIIGVFLATVRIASATTFNSDGSPTNIQSIHDNQAQNGDTITVPSGTFTWATKITITKAITLQGQGVGTTIIKDNVQSGNTFLFTLVANQLTRVTGIEFQDGGRVNAQPAPVGVFHVNGSNTDGSKFRMDNSKLVELNGMVVLETVLGVIDHCSFVNGNTSGNIWVYGSNWNGGGSYGDASWVAPTNFGSADFLFFEDCDFHNENATYESVSAEPFAGGRLVARHCTLYNTQFGDHGTESGGRIRGGRAAEIYNNTWTGTNRFNSICGARSCRIIVHDNTISGFTNGGSIGLQCYRTFYAFSPWGGADATNAWDVNEPTVFYTGTAASNSSGQTVTVSGTPNWTTNYWAGYTIRRTSNLGGLNTVTYAWINSNTSNTITYTTNGGYSSPVSLAFTAGDSLEFRKLDHELDQPGRGQGSLITGVNPTPPPGWNDQVTEPCYCWNNGSAVFWAGPGVRDGIHCFSNTQMPGYTPYTYPHPLVGGSTPPGTPPAVRDGTGADIAYTTLNTQLSANWDAATDPDGSVTALSVCHRHFRRRHANRQLDDPRQRHHRDQDWVVVDQWANLLFQREGRRQPGLGRQRHEFQRPNRRHHRAQRPGHCPRRNGSRHLDHQFHHAIIGQLGRRHRQRQRHQRLPICHRHHRRRHPNRQLDLAGQRDDGDQDRLVVERGADLLTSA